MFAKLSDRFWRKSKEFLTVLAIVFTVALTFAAAIVPLYMDDANGTM